jgi:hypothetical protein
MSSNSTTFSSDKRMALPWVLVVQYFMPPYILDIMNELQ